MELKENMIITFISYFLSAITSLLIAWYTAKRTIKNTEKEHIRNERETLYIEVFNLVQKLRDNPCCLFTYDEIIGPFNELRTKINFYGSEELIKELNVFYLEMRIKYEEYIHSYGDEQIACNEEKVESGEFTEEELELEEETYKEQHAFPEVKVLEIQRKLITIMRKDLHIIGTVKRLFLWVKNVIWRDLKNLLRTIQKWIRLRIRHCSKRRI